MGGTRGRRTRRGFLVYLKRLEEQRKDDAFARDSVLFNTAIVKSLVYPKNLTGRDFRLSDEGDKWPSIRHMEHTLRHTGSRILLSRITANTRT